MKIDSLKTSLRHLVLLAKEYKEKIPDSSNEEISELEKPVESGLGLDEYSKQRLIDLRQEKRQNEEDLFKQLVYFTEKLLSEFSKPFNRGWHFEIDQDKITEALKSLSGEEVQLLNSIWELYKGIEELECYKTGAYKPSEIKELKPEISKVMKNAILTGL